MLHYPAPTLPARAALACADVCAALSRRLYALPMACPLPLYRAAVLVAECADACADATMHAGRATYAATLLGTARVWRKCAHGEAPEMAGFYRAMARARVADARDVVGRQRGVPYCGPYAYSETSGY